MEMKKSKNNNISFCNVYARTRSRARSSTWRQTVLRKIKSKMIYIDLNSITYFNNSSGENNSYQ